MLTNCTRRDRCGWSCSSIHGPNLAMVCHCQPVHAMQQMATTHCLVDQNESCWHTNSVLPVLLNTAVGSVLHEVNGASRNAFWKASGCISTLETLSSSAYDTTEFHGTAKHRRNRAPLCVLIWKKGTLHVTKMASNNFRYFYAEEHVVSEW